MTLAVWLFASLCLVPCAMAQTAVARGACQLPGVPDAAILEEANTVLRATQGLDAPAAEIDWVVLDCQRGALDVLVRGIGLDVHAHPAVGTAHVPLSDAQAWPAVQMGLRSAAAHYARLVQGLDRPPLPTRGTALGYGVSAWLGGLNNVGAGADFVVDLTRTRLRFGLGAGSGFAGWTADTSLQAALRASRLHYAFVQLALAQLTWWRRGYEDGWHFGPYRFVDVGAGYGGQLSRNVAIELGAHLQLGHTALPYADGSSTMFALSIALAWSSVPAIEPNPLL